MEACGICLMSDGDLWEPAPCGYTGARFHVACIAAMSSGALRRCPHCNAAVGAEFEIKRLAEAWMSRGGFWDDAGGSFVEVQRGGLQHGLSEDKTLSAIVAAVVGVMMKQASSCVCVSRCDDATRCFSCIDRASRFALTLRRTAFYGRRGRILRDGYALGASRRRVSGRLIKAIASR